MAESTSRALSPMTGEFLAPEREAAFQAGRLPETLRLSRLALLTSALLTLAFLVGDWRFFGKPHFEGPDLARIAMVLIAFGCFWAVRQSAHFKQIQRSMAAWTWLNGTALAALVSLRSDLTFFAALLLPTVYYLVVPISFRWSVISGVGCSLMLLAVYLATNPFDGTATGLVLTSITLNLVLVLVLARANRLQRMGWSATQAEQRAQEDLANSRALFETMFKTVPIPLVVVRENGSIVEHNDAAIQYFGTTPEALGIQKIVEVYVDPRDLDEFMAVLLKEGQVTNFETQIRLADGTTRTVLLVGRALEIDGVQHIMSGAIDITDRKAAEDRVWRTASHDPLTNLPNRAYFQSRFEQVIAQAERNGGSIALLILGLDNLRTVSDALGYEAGDALLKEVAARLSHLAEGCDTVARLERDEFALVMLDPPDLDHAKALADNILEELKQPFPHEGGALLVQARIGIASYPGHDRQPSDLMKNADLALKAAKVAGGNGAVLYSPEMRQESEQATTLLQEIREALRLRQIVPFYQPKIDITTGRVLGFEALARWNHPVRGLLAPAHFTIAFEDPELSIAFGEYMIRRVAEDIKEWLRQGIDCGRIAVNLSTAQFSWIGLAKRLLDILHTADVPSNRLELEITETVFLGRSAPHVVTALRQFHESGIKIALDDFGTGYASLIHLKQFPIDSIKIDQSFVRDLKNDAGSEAIVLAITRLGMSLGMDVVAEGVETSEQASFLRTNGCTQVQGYLYAKPMAASLVEQFLNRQETPGMTVH